MLTLRGAVFGTAAVASIVAVDVDAFLYTGGRLRRGLTLAPSPDGSS
jgi:hypothetical protein